MTAENRGWGSRTGRRAKAFNEAAADDRGKPPPPPGRRRRPGSLQ